MKKDELKMLLEGMMAEKIAMDNFELYKGQNENRKTRRKYKGRKARQRYTDLNKKHLEKISKYAMVEINLKTLKIKDWGDKSYFKGDKCWSRKDRHQRFYEPAEVEVAGMVTLDEDDFGLDEGYVNGEFVGYTTDDTVGTIGDILTDDFWWNYMSINNAWMYKYNYMIDELMYMKKRLHMIQSKLDKLGDGFGEWMWGVM